MENQDEIVSYFHQVVEIRMKEKKQEKKRKFGSSWTAFSKPPLETEVEGMLGCDYFHVS